MWTSCVVDGLQDAQSSRLGIVAAVEEGDVSTLCASLGHLDPQALRFKLRGRTAAGQTPLTMAVEKGDEAMVGRLIEWGAEVDLANRDGMTPLKLAAHMGRPDLIRRLCAAGALMHDVKWEEGDKPILARRTYDALPEAAKHVEALTALLELGAEAAGRAGQMVLRGAVNAGTATVVKALLPYMGRWLSLKVGPDAVLCAITKGQEEVLRELLLSGAEDSDEWRSLLKRAEARAKTLRRRCPLALKASHGTNRGWVDQDHEEAAR
jgi:ankyrin repeat protein